jgi:hypothetical protein
VLVEESISSRSPCAFTRCLLLIFHPYRTKVMSWACCLLPGPRYTKNKRIGIHRVGIHPRWGAPGENDRLGRASFGTPTSPVPDSDSGPIIVRTGSALVSSSRIVYYRPSSLAKFQQVSWLLFTAVHTPTNTRL